MLPSCLFTECFGRAVDDGTPACKHGDHNVFLLPLRDVGGCFPRVHFRCGVGICPVRSSHTNIKPRFSLQSWVQVGSSSHTHTYTKCENKSYPYIDKDDLIHTYIHPYLLISLSLFLSFLVCFLACGVDCVDGMGISAYLWPCGAWTRYS